MCRGRVVHAHCDDVRELGADVGAGPGAQRVDADEERAQQRERERNEEIKKVTEVARDRDRVQTRAHTIMTKCEAEQAHAKSCELAAQNPALAPPCRKP